MYGSGLGYLHQINVFSRPILEMGRDFRQHVLYCRIKMAGKGYICRLQPLLMFSISSQFLFGGSRFIRIKRCSISLGCSVLESLRISFDSSISDGLYLPSADQMQSAFNALKSTFLSTTGPCLKPSSPLVIIPDGSFPLLSRIPRQLPARSWWFPQSTTAFRCSRPWLRILRAWLQGEGLSQR